jgi:predicted PurR-regulated permease PerM
MIHAAPSQEAERRPPFDVAVVAGPRHWATLLILLLVTGVLAALTPFLPGLLGAPVLCVFLKGPYERLSSRMQPWLAALVTVVSAFMLIITPLGWLVGVLTVRAPGAVSAALASPLLARVGAYRVGQLQLGDALSRMSDSIVATISSELASFMGTATSITINLTLALFGAYYLLGASARTWEFARAYVPFSARTADALRDRFVDATQATLIGTGVVSVLQGVLVGLGFAITGLPEPALWGAVAAVAAIIPAIGTTVVWLPGLLFLTSQHRYGAAVTLLVFGAGLGGNVGQIVRPLVYRRMSDMHPMITFVGVLAGLRILGIVGLLLGPLAIVFVFELLRFYREEYTSG